MRIMKIFLVVVAAADYSEGNGDVSGEESEDEGARREHVNNSQDNEIPLQSHNHEHNEIEKSTTEATTTVEAPSARNLTLPCDLDRGGCDHECQMFKYDYDPEPIIQCSCYKGFVLDEMDGRRCHGKSIFPILIPSALIKFNLNFTDINECDSDHGCEQICNNLPGSFECACHPGLQIDSSNNKKCIGEL